MAFLQKLAASLRRGRAAELPKDDKDAFYILMPMVIGNQHRSVSDLLSSSKFQVSFQCGRAQRSLLHIAATCGNYECLCLLLKKGSEINQQDKSGCTPLHLSAKNGQRKCLNKLLEYECDINIRNNEGLTAVHWLAVNGRTELLEDMLSRIKDVDIEDAQGQTPLHVACQNGHLQTLLCLVNNGANVNKANKSAWTPLHFACKHGQHEAVDILLKHGAELRPEVAGRTPLALCLEEGYGETCEVLLRQWPRLFDYLVRTVCDVTISEENVLKVLTHLCHQDWRLKEKFVEGLAERVSIIGHHLLSNSSQEVENSDSLIRAVRVLLRVEKVQHASRLSESQDLQALSVDHTNLKPVCERQCLLTLWQLIDDWMVFLDTDDRSAKSSSSGQPSNNTENTGSSDSTPTKASPSPVVGDTDSEPTQVCTDLSAKTDNTSKPSEEKSVAQNDSVCPEEESQSVSSAAKTEGGDQARRSPEVARICALIQAFYLCTQNSKEKSSNASSKFFSFLQRHITTLRKFVERDPQLIFNHFHFLLSCPGYMAEFLTIIHGQPFESRRQWFYDNLPTPAQWDLRAEEEESQATVRISREQLFSSSCQEILHRPPEQLKTALSIIFSGEEGLGQGLVREWFDLLSKELLNPDYALFTMSADGCTFQPNSNSAINPDHLSYFRFAGRLLGLALFHRQLLSTYFTRSFYKHILGVPVNYQDVASIDPEYAKSLQWLLDHDITDLGLDLTFSVETDTFGSMQEVELVRGGSKMSVTEQNKTEYVQLVTELRMTRAIKPQIDSFLSGFHDYIPHSLVQLFNEYELELLLSGMPEIDLSNWKTNSNYTGYSTDTPVVEWYWEFVDSMTEQQRVQLLQFVTGSSRVPFGGFSQLSSGGSIQMFTISRQPCPPDPPFPLPTASTCINLLRLPEYPSSAVLQDRLLTALRCGSQGYGMV
ncbi:hypothetical protein V1264_015110 [Littorina saxatilis]